MAEISTLTDEQLQHKINAAKLTIERNSGLIKEASEKKLVQLLAEQATRSGAADTKKEATEIAEEKVEKIIDKAIEKAEEKAEQATEGKSEKKGKGKAKESKYQKDLNKIISQATNAVKKGTARKLYDKWESDNSSSENAILLAIAVGNKEDLKEASDIYIAHSEEGSLSDKNRTERDELSKKLWTKFIESEEKTEKTPKAKIEKTPKAEEVQKEAEETKGAFTLNIEGVEYKFSDLESKNACEKALKAVKATHVQQIHTKEAQAEGREKAKEIPVTQRIADGFISVAKKAVSEIPRVKIDKNPDEIRKEINAVEKAFENLFDKLEILMDRKIPAEQRNQIMAILTKFEEKLDKGSDKKETATTKIRKEDGGLVSKKEDNSWSYISLLK